MNSEQLTETVNEETKPEETKPEETKPEEITPKKKSSKLPRIEYSVPSGKLQSCETPGFNMERHKQLSASAFADPLDYFKWLKWFHEQHVAKAEASIEQMISRGDSVEERSIEMDIMRAKKKVQQLEKKKQEAKKKAKEAAAKKK